MTSLNKGILMNIHSQVRKELGNAGHYFDVDPFQINLYDSFQSQQKNKMIPETIQILKSKNKDKKHKKITLGTTKETKETKETKDTKTNKSLPTPHLKDNPLLQSSPPLQDNPALKTIHITNIIPDKDKGDIQL